MGGDVSSRPQNDKRGAEQREGLEMRGADGRDEIKRDKVKRCYEMCAVRGDGFMTEGLAVSLKKVYVGSNLKM